MDGGGKGGLYLRLSAQFGEVGGRKRGEGGGNEMEREKYKNKKRNTGINKRRVTFFLTCTGLEPRRIIMEEGDLLQGA